MPNVLVPSIAPIKPREHLGASLEVCRAFELSRGALRMVGASCMVSTGVVTVFWSNRGIRKKHHQVGVVARKAAVLGEFLAAPGLGYAHIRRRQDVWSARVAIRRRCGHIEAAMLTRTPQHASCPTPDAERLHSLSAEPRMFPPSRPSPSCDTNSNEDQNSSGFGRFRLDLRMRPSRSCRSTSSGHLLVISGRRWHPNLRAYRGRGDNNFIGRSASTIMMSGTPDR